MKAVTIPINRSECRKLLLFLSAIALIICFALLQMRSVFAEDASGSAQTPVNKYNITFPVSTLGNCADLQSCKAYCEDPVNKEACISFAKSKGFYKEPPKSEGNVRSKLILEKAKVELGCNTEQDCKALCQDQSNAEKCAAFAKKYGIGKEKEDLTRKSIVEKAKSFLGCTSEETCKAFCQDSKNHEKCSQFAKMAGLTGGMVKVASMSGKNQEGLDQVKKLIERCKANPTYCQQNIDAIQEEITQKSDQFCKDNPQRCKEFMKELTNLQESSRAGKFIPNSEKAFENANDRARFCRENPAKCLNASGSADIRGASTSMSLWNQILHFFFK
jgi:hypothetical protein